jgi:2-polyprenyl-6-methoxyphenol hydroxylase-like FAD-dependent oxidoreductase
MRGTAVVGLALALALATAGCGSDTIDAAKVEAGIQQSLSSATASVSSVSCPDDIEKEEGATFTCDAKLEGGGTAKVKVTQTTKGGDFTYSFKPGTVVLTDNAVEPALETELTASGLPNTTVDCPDTIKVKEGEKVTCTATGSGGRQSQLTFAFSSTDGTIDESSVSGSGS